MQAHGAQAVEQGAGILQHHPRLLALVDQLRDKFADALVAPMEHRRVVIIANALVLHHVLEIADDGRGVQVTATRRNQWLMHVQGDGAGSADVTEIDAAFRQEHRAGATGAQSLFHERLRTADVRQTVNVLWKLAHAWRSPGQWLDESGIGCWPSAWTPCNLGRDLRRQRCA